MAQACRQCGAPLDAARVGEVSGCRFCGLVAGAAASTTQQRTGPFGDGTPRPLLRVWAAVGALSALGATASALLVGGPSSPPPVPVVPRTVVTAPPTATVVRVPRAFWAASPPGCELDANGDGVADMAGLSGDPSNDKFPTLIDGATGAALWHGQAVSSRVQLGCLGKEWLFVVSPSFEAELYAARNPVAPVRVLLRDTVDQYGLGEGCAKLKTSDGALTGLQLPGGLAVPCDAPLRRYYGGRKPGLIGLTEEATELVRGKRSYKLQKRRNGTAMLTLSVEEGGKRLWKKELPYAAPTFSTGLAAGDGAIVLWAAKPGATDRGLLIGIDEASGEQLYEKPSTSLVSNDIGFISFNGRYVVVQCWSALSAFEPKTGTLAWTVGS